MNLNARVWKQFYLKDLFEIRMGNGFDKNKMSEDNPSVNFVSRVSYNNGVDGKVDIFEDTAPYPAGLLTVALGGSYLGSCFVQEEPFYTAQNVAVMKAVAPEMSNQVNIFISCLVRYESKVKYYAFGRELNSHINRDFSIELPVKQNTDGSAYIDINLRYSKQGYVPDWEFIESYIHSIHHKPLTTNNKHKDAQALFTDNWKEFKIGALFDIQLSKGDIKLDEMDFGCIPLVSSGESNNGIVGHIDASGDGKAEIFPGNKITLDMFGNAFYQPEDFYAVSHGRVNILSPNFKLTPNIGLFISAIINQERYRFSYGRAVYSSVAAEMVIYLPVQKDEEGKPIMDMTSGFSEFGFIPDWGYMEKYINALPYGDRI